jgi:hypothetical protein
MAGFISDAQKQNIKNIVDKIHDTFARDIIVYQEGSKQNVTPIASYNAYYKRGTEPKPKLVQNSRTIKARIQYKSLQQGDFYQESAQEKIVIPEGQIFIIVSLADAAFMSTAKIVELDGKTYSINSPGLPQGMFGPQYFKYSVIPLEI